MIFLVCLRLCVCLYASVSVSLCGDFELAATVAFALYFFACVHMCMCVGVCDPVCVGVCMFALDRLPVSRPLFLVVHLEVPHPLLW